MFHWATGVARNDSSPRPPPPITSAFPFHCVRERTVALTQGEEARAALQEQLRKRSEELATRQRALDEQVQAWQAKSDMLAEERDKLEQAHQDTLAQVEVRRQELQDWEKALKAQQGELAERDAKLGQHAQQLQDMGRTVAEQREALQDAIRIAEAELKSYSSGRVIGEMEDMFRTNMNGFTTSAAAAIIGIVVTLLAIAAPGGVIGASVIYASATVAFVVGAPLAALGSIAALRYYRKVTADTKRDFNQRVDQLQRTYHEALDDLTQRERNRLKS